MKLDLYCAPLLVLASRIFEADLQFEHHLIDRDLPTDQRGTGEYGLTAIADVDGDGDIDICPKAWGSRPWNGNSGRMHVDFLENLSKRPRAPAK